jgi:CSLREA domain-containing protein
LSFASPFDYRTLLKPTYYASLLQGDFVSSKLRGLIATLFLASSAQAATITVNTTADTATPGQCSLRDAVTAANTNAAVNGCAAGSAGADTIVFSLPVASTINLANASAEIRITESLLIDGTAVSGLTIDGNKANRSQRVFRAEKLQSTDPNIELSLNKLILRNGTLGILEPSGFGGALVFGKALQSFTARDVIAKDSQSNSSGGGCFSLQDTLTISVFFSTFQGCVAYDSAGIKIANPTNTLLVPTVSITDSRFTGNIATYRGGGLGAQGLEGINLNIARSSFDGNESRYGGAGVYASVISSGRLGIAQSSFSNNDTVNAQANGGALQIEGNVANAWIGTLSNNTFSGHRGGANNGLGAVQLSAGNFTINQSTFSGNRLSSDSFGGGGALGINTATVTINNSTFSDNAVRASSGRAGGAIYIGDQATVTINSSIVANSGDSDLPPTTAIVDIARASGMGFTNTLNVSDSLIQRIAPGGINGSNSGNLFNVNPLLGPLANNGGLTQTHEPQAGSPAINTGANPINFGFDQRGLPYARVAAGRADMGAVETQTLPAQQVPGLTIGGLLGLMGLLIALARQRFKA